MTDLFQNRLILNRLAAYLPTHHLKIPPRPEYTPPGLKTLYQAFQEIGRDLFGELWTGDVGWEAREMVYRIDRGANYGWSVVEGSQSVKPQGVRHPVPITPPIFEYDHTEGRSITGGHFWNSRRLPDLYDAYLYGDFVSGKIWGLKYDGQKITWQKEIVQC